MSGTLVFGEVVVLCSSGVSVYARVWCMWYGLVECGILC